MHEGMPGEKRPRWSGVEVMHELKGAFVLTTFMLTILGISTHFDAGKKLVAQMPDVLKWQLVIPAAEQAKAHSASVQPTHERPEYKSFTQNDGKEIKVIFEKSQTYGFGSATSEKGSKKVQEQVRLKNKSKA